jgi:hypothetical protein
MSLKVASLAGALLLGAAAIAPALAPAFAQGQPSGTAAGTTPAPRPLPPSHIEGRIAFLKTELKITDAQAPQWNAFADVLRQLDKARRDRWEQMHAAGAAQPNALERLQRRETMAEARAQQVKQYASAFRPLYVVLSDDQKKTADELLAGRERHHFRHGRF